MANSHSITAVVPCYNEQECVLLAYSEITKALNAFDHHEIIFVDDGSTDDTLKLIREISATDGRVRYISFTRNFGLEAAFSAGYRYARYPWAVQFDADLQSPPSELTKLFEKALEDFDVVFAMRIQRQDPAFRRLGSYLQHWAATRIFGIQLPLRGSVFRVVRTSVAKKIVALNLGTPYFLATVPLIGARYASVPTEHRARVAGKAKWNLSQLCKHSFELFTAFSFRMFLAVYALALLLSSLAIVAAVLFVFGQLGPSYFALFACIALSGISLDLAIIGRYTVRIAKGQSRSPQHYLIRQANFAIHPSDSLYEYESIGLSERRAS